MKKTLLFLLSVIAIAACSSPESVAERALKEIGNGKYKTGVTGINFSKASMNKDIFTDALLYTSYGEQFSKYQGCSSVLSITTLMDVYFKTDILFDKVTLIDKKKFTQDIYGFFKKDPGDEKTFEALKKCFKSREGFQANDYVLAYLKYKDVPCYELRYKADNTYIFSVIVLKLPDEGYRVGMVTFD